MNAITANEDFAGYGLHDASVSNVETYWGYIIRDQSGDRTVAILMQWAAAVLGVSLLVAVIGFWVLPGAMVSQDVFGFKIGVTAVMVVVGMALVWFASYGTNYEVQVDLARQELREVLRTNRGAARVQKRVKFEDIDAVFVDRSAGEDAKAELIVRLAASSNGIVVASDYEEHLTRIYTRMGRDILGTVAQKPAKANRGFKFEGARGVIEPAFAA